MQVELASLALVIAVSPASVIPAILMLHTPRPLAAGWAFAIGWILSVAATTLLFAGIAGQFPDIGGPPPEWIRPATMLLAVLLIFAGVVVWMRRGRAERSFTDMAAGAGLRHGAAGTGSRTGTGCRESQGALCLRCGRFQHRCHHADQPGAVG